MLGNKSSMLILMLRTKVPGNKNSKERKFQLWNFRSRERKFSGTQVPVTYKTGGTVGLYNQKTSCANDSHVYGPIAQ